MRRASALLAAASLLIVVSAGADFAKSSRKEKASPPPPASAAEGNPVMAQFLTNLQALQPFMTAEKAFSAPENAAAIDARLSALATDTRSLNHYNVRTTPGFAISATVLQDNVRQTEMAFTAGRTEYARRMLNETMQSCISCHSQLTSGASSLVVPAETVKGTKLERAEFLFATREFDDALKLYDQVLGEYHPALPSGGAIPMRTAEAALKHELAIYLRVRRDPEKAATTLDRQLENGALPSSLRELMSQWSTELRKPGLVPAFNPKTLSRPELTAYVSNIFGRDEKDANLLQRPWRAVHYLLLSGVLYEALQTNRPDLPAPELLYWLTKTDRSLGSDFFFSMPDLYLQECVRRAPRTPIARKCFRDFEASVTQQYTDGRGSQIPDEVQAMLSDLRKLAQS